MKTALSIERQESKKSDEKDTLVRAENSSPVSSKRGPGRYGDAWQLKPYHFQPGVYGNPGGRPKTDLAAELARQVFEENFPAIKAAFSKALKKGSAYSFQVLSDRAFGKLKEVHQVEHSRFSDASNEQIEQQIAELQGKLIEHLREQGYTITPPVQPQLLPPADDEKKPN